MLRNCLALFMNRAKSFQTIYFHNYSLAHTLFLGNTSHCTIMTMLTFVRNSLNSLFELRCLLRIQKQSLACKVFISNSLPSTNFYAYIILNVMRKKLCNWLLKRNCPVLLFLLQDKLQTTYSAAYNNAMDYGGSFS